MIELFKIVLDIVPKIFTFCQTIIEVLTMPFTNLWANAVNTLPVWAEFLITPIAWLMNTIMPYDASLLELMLLFIVPVYIIWTIGKYFAK